MGKHDKHAVDVERLAYTSRPCLAICAGKHCARSGAKSVIRAAEAALAEAGLAENVPVVLTKCQDHCDDGPAMTVVPGAFPYIDLCPDSVRQIVLSHVRDGQPVLDLLHKRARKKLKRVMER